MDSCVRVRVRACLSGLTATRNQVVSALQYVCHRLQLYRFHSCTNVPSLPGASGILWPRLYAIGSHDCLAEEYSSSMVVTRDRPRPPAEGTMR